MMDSPIDPTLISQHTRPSTLRLNGHGDLSKLRKQAQDFEAVFIGEMLRPMFENIQAEEPFGGGQSEQMWRDMQVDEYGKALARQGGIGLADAVLDQLIRMQESQNHVAVKP